MDPLKATAYDREPGGGSSGRTPPPPVPVELLDAGDSILTVLWSARVVLGGQIPEGRYQIRTGTGAERAYRYALDAVRALLDGLEEFATLPAIAAFGDAVIGAPADSDGWTIAKAMGRWGLVDAPWWAAQPCPIPDCGLRAVKVTPPTIPGDDIEYSCTKCGWSEFDEDGFWAEAFSRRTLGG